MPISCRLGSEARRGAARRGHAEAIVERRAHRVSRDVEAPGKGRGEGEGEGWGEGEGEG